MSFLRGLLLRAFGRPEGLLGRIGGVLMARGNRDCAAWVVDQLAINADDAVLEVGFGPGVGIALAAEAAPAGRVAGVDPSAEMLAQAKARNAEAMRSSHVDLHLGSVERSGAAAASRSASRRPRARRKTGSAPPSPPPASPSPCSPKPTPSSACSRRSRDAKAAPVLLPSLRAFAIFARNSRKKSTI
jgi:SAM-dependent methyltransferase